MFNALKTFDAYPKTMEDFRVKTFSGAMITLIAGSVILFLFISEFSLYVHGEVRREVHVDPTFGDKLRINLDITFHALPCAFLSLDAMDVAGELQLDLDHTIFKKRLDLEGNAISGFEKDDLGRNKGGAEDAGEAGAGEAKEALDPSRCESCYGAETRAGQCCNTCAEVQEAYRLKGWAFQNHEGIVQCVREGWSDKLRAQAKEGCSVSGHLIVNKVAGNFHIAPGKSFQQQHMHVHDLQPFHQSFWNLSHTIEQLSFGKPYPGIRNPLDGASVSNERAVSTMYQYFLKIVPTSYARADGLIIGTNQFSVTEHAKPLTGGSHGLPGVFFMYDVSPMVVRLSEDTKSFAHFLVGVCAIVGGVFTVAGLIDAFIYTGMRSLGKKLELGKHS